MTTMTEFYSRMAGITIPDVVKSYEHPPVSLGADLPAFWVQQPVLSDTMMTFGSNGGWATFGAQCVIAVAPVAQDNQGPNWTRALGFAHALHDALKDARPAVGPLKWDACRVGVMEVAGTAYWVVTADVETYG